MHLLQTISFSSSDLYRGGEVSLPPTIPYNQANDHSSAGSYHSSDRGSNSTSGTPALTLSHTAQKCSGLSFKCQLFFMSHEEKLYLKDSLMQILGETLRHAGLVLGGCFGWHLYGRVFKTSCVSVLPALSVTARDHLGYENSTRRYNAFI